MAPSTHPTTTCLSTTRITAKLLLSFLVLSPLAAATIAPYARQRDDTPAIPADILAPGPVIIGENGSRGSGENEPHEFSLRHILHHGTYQYPHLLRRLDIYSHTLVATEDNPELLPRPKYRALSRPANIHRLKERTRDDVEARLLAHRQGASISYALDAWTVDQIPQPNITDKPTVLAMAKIAADAYIEVERTEDWLEVGSPYNLTDDFGWKQDGLRGHIFADQDNSTVIIGLKGTSAAVFDGAETTTNDKINDNLFFSCCCARVSYWWSTVCDCFTGSAYTCNTTCLKEELIAENRYYRAALQLYYNVTQMYPDSNIWVVGHSLGGALSSLIGQTYGLPVVAFEAPGEALASDRLGLPIPPNGARQSSDLAVWHFGHTADPIFMGTCNGPTSPCSIGGYAMETRCHAGMECVYDVVSDRGWRMGLGYHRIQGVIRDVIMTYDDVPVCTYDPGCVDCFNWNFVTGNETTPTTTSSVPTSTSMTSTTTCHTPGWWGCRDPTTTATSTETTPTTTATCTHYGWFGNCLDPTETTSLTTTTTTSTVITTTVSTIITSTASTTTCLTPGWFGCKDTTTATRTQSLPTSTTTTCAHHGLFGRCLDQAVVDIL